MNKYEKYFKRLGKANIRLTYFHYRMRDFKRQGKKTHYILSYYGYLPQKQKKTGLKTLKKKS